MYKIAIPYRDRKEELDLTLPVFLRKLRDYNIPYEYAIIEQDNDKNFNYSRLINSGFDILKPYSEKDTFVFCTVDRVPNFFDLLNCFENECKFFVFDYGTEQKKINTNLPLRYDFFSIKPKLFERLDGLCSQFEAYGYEDAFLVYKARRCKIANVNYRQAFGIDLGENGDYYRHFLKTSPKVDRNSLLYEQLTKRLDNGEYIKDCLKSNKYRINSKFKHPEYENVFWYKIDW